MALAKITEIKGRGVFVPGNDIDTDRIIPARFMKCITFDGLGEFLFYDVRKNADGSVTLPEATVTASAGEANVSVPGRTFSVTASSAVKAPKRLVSWYVSSVSAVIASPSARR